MPAFAIAALLILVTALPAHAAGRIDRQALVARHSPHLTAPDPWAPLSVGNGRFCFTADVTGLQTFADHYRANGIGLETQARWAWHEDPNPHGYKLADANKAYTAHGKTVDYPTRMDVPAAAWLRENPHPQPLGQLAIAYTHRDGKPLALADVGAIDQRLDLWRGVLTSAYTIDGEQVVVTTAVDPTRDTLAVRIESKLLARGLAVRLALPRGYVAGIKQNPPLDWSQPASHTTTVVTRTDRTLVLAHARDGYRYGVALRASTPLDIATPAPHTFALRPKSGHVLEFTLAYAPDAPAPDAADVFARSAAHWPAFWRSGGAVDFSGSTDPRAAELERRVVLSQYLTAIQAGGDFPPQESGLTTSTWYGKHHTEMIWWHTAHFALWGRPAYLARALDWFRNTLPAARAIAAQRGLQGARWPKMTSPQGRESPGGNPLIVWNQPHPIHLAELLYRDAPTPATLRRYRDLVFATADAMASMLAWDDRNKRWVLGPPLWIAQEIHDPAASMNPAYELSYWSTALDIAQQWRTRLGLPRNAEWDEKRRHLSALPVKDGRYVALESIPDTWDDVASRQDHPSFLMALGQLPGAGVDRAVMNRTLDAVLAQWDWKAKIWGWDYPMIAMTAARLGRPETAVDVLMKTGVPNNGYTAAGHNPNTDLPVYLPGNGALLAAVAMMAGGWDGAPAGTAPGFPHDGTWTVRAEGLAPLP
ncbi:hypothetical protein IA69_20805 [Massilia sp. JS1662]|nr:hypothetical protein [Massilia sp. JS1662]KGF80060.1 hypothetical protein IA69_20805 [Massilia sp. JS1662]